MTISSEDELTGILRRLRSESALTQSHGALMLAWHAEWVEKALPTLIATLEETELKHAELAGSTRTAEKVIFEWSARALSAFLDQGSGSAEAVEVAKEWLMRMARSPVAEIAATGMRVIGELRADGEYGWDYLLQTCNCPGNDCKEGQVALRAIAYRAMLRINEERTLALGNVPAKSELEVMLRQRLADRKYSENSEYLASLRQEISILER